MQITPELLDDMDIELQQADTKDSRSAVCEKYGFEYVAASGRLLAKHKQSGEYYKFARYRPEENAKEVALYESLNGHKCQRYLAKVEKVSQRVIKCEFVDGINLWDLPNPNKARKRIDKVVRLINKRGFFDIADLSTAGNVKFPKNGIGGLKIVDYAESWPLSRPAATQKL